MEQVQDQVVAEMEPQGQAGALSVSQAGCPATSIGWQGNRLFGSPAKFETVAKCCESYPGLLGPFSKCACDAIYRHAAVVTAIIGLLFWCCKSDVAGFITPVVIDTFNSQAELVDILDVFPEGSKIVPAGADRDSSGTIVGIGAHIGIFTSCDHGFPYVVDRQSRHAVSATSFTYRFHRRGATTTLGVMGNKVSLCDSDFISAIALASPIASPIARLSHFEDSEFTKSLTDKASFSHASTTSARAAREPALPCHYSIAAVAFAQPHPDGDMILGVITAIGLFQNSESSVFLADQIGLATFGLLGYGGLRHSCAPCSQVCLGQSVEVTSQLTARIMRKTSTLVKEEIA